MELHHLPIFIYVVFSLALAGKGHNNALLSDEDYWKAVWPNTPIPSGLRDLMKHDPTDTEITDLPMKIEDTQYPKTLFFKHDLYPGKTMNFQFSKDPFQQPYGVWLTSDNVERERYTFKEICIQKGAPKAKQMYCAISLGTLMGFAISKLGKNIQVLSSAFVSKQEQYTLEGMQNLGDKTVICHRLNFENVAFYCHKSHASTAFVVSLVAGDGTKTQALAICHDDTSDMNHDMLYRMLKVDPGTNSVCHFLGNKSVLWVPNLVVDNAYSSNIAS
ncbi:unnamed protein product [Lupinus luteus]|uniref:BURP domain-containing protein n=1 Tax=Lupinus luteus TaxID=3873 RepID=A0AAV1XM82_LUPLU